MKGCTFEMGDLPSGQGRGSLLTRIIDPCLAVNKHPLQFFFLALILAGDARAAEIQPGTTCRRMFTDVDGKTISTFDGHVTLVAVVTRETEADARVLADRVPRKYYGDPHVRLVTVVNFQGKLYRSVHGVTAAFIRRRLDGEARRLQPIYQANRLSSDPRHDLFVIADFTGQVSATLGVPRDASNSTVLVFRGDGRLQEGWSEVPSAAAVASALIAADEQM